MNDLPIKSADRRLFKQFTVGYSIALTLIALLSIISQMRIQSHLTRSMDDSHVINFAARLRTYSQILSKSALMLENGYDYESSKKEFVNTLRQMEKSQEGLESGSKFLNLPKDNMEDINDMFSLISRPREEIISAAEKIANILDTTKHFKPDLIRLYVKSILDNERSYLLGMDLIVFDYDNFSKDRINQLKQTDYIVFAILLLTLILEALFIFYPLARHVQRVVTGLILSEDESRNLNHKLQQAKENSEKSHNELREINFALDKATFLVKTDPDGHIIYANDKYCHVTRYNMSELRNKPVFYNNMGGRESIIYDHIRNPLKRHEVWQDEIFDHDKDGRGFWLDVTLIPVFDNSGELYQYLVIGNDITSRKNTEMENKKLTEEIIQWHRDEQQIKSYAIINGQEKERKRIAAEIHDGIGMMLTSVRMKLEQFEDKISQPDTELVAIHIMLKSLITETRRICSDLLPSVLEDFGLRSAIEDLIKTCQSANKKMEFLLDENIQQIPLPRELKITIYRILQEALNNVIKHADATRAEIFIDVANHSFNLIIKDNGKGFNFDMHQLHSKLMVKKMNGIRGMKERAELLDGNFNIITEQGKGTVIQLEVPLVNEQEN